MHTRWLPRLVLFVTMLTAHSAYATLTFSKVTETFPTIPGQGDQPQLSSIDQATMITGSDLLPIYIPVHIDFIATSSRAGATLTYSILNTPASGSFPSGTEVIGDTQISIVGAANFYLIVTDFFATGCG